MALEGPHMDPTNKYWGPQHIILQRKTQQPVEIDGFYLVGAVGFEPTTR